MRSLVDAKDLASLLTVEEGQLMIEACEDISYGTSFIHSVWGQAGEGKVAAGPTNIKEAFKVLVLRTQDSAENGSLNIIMGAIHIFNLYGVLCF